MVGRILLVLLGVAPLILARRGRDDATTEDFYDCVARDQPTENRFGIRFPTCEERCMSGVEELEANVTTCLEGSRERGVELVRHFADCVNETSEEPCVIMEESFARRVVRFSTGRRRSKAVKEITKCLGSCFFRRIALCGKYHIKCHVSRKNVARQRDAQARCQADTLEYAKTVPYPEECTRSSVSKFGDLASFFNRNPKSGEE